MSVTTERDLLELGPTVIREHMRQSNRFNQQELPGMSAAEIVAGIRGNNAHLMQALKMPVEFRQRYQIDSATIVGMLEQGVIEAVFDKLSFPQAIDSTDAECQKVIARILDLLNSLFAGLNSRGQDGPAFVKWNNEMVKQLGPVIMTLCNKKRRLYNCRPMWFASQRGFLLLVHNCVHTGGVARIRLFHDEMKGIALTTIAEHIVFWMTLDSDPSLLLDINAVGADFIVMMNRDFLAAKWLAVGILIELVAVHHFGDSFGTLIGKLVVPDGAIAGLSGQQYVAMLKNSSSSSELQVAFDEHTPETVHLYHQIYFGSIGFIFHFKGNGCIHFNIDPIITF